MSLEVVLILKNVTDNLKNKTYQLIIGSVHGKIANVAQEKASDERKKSVDIMQRCVIRYKSRCESGGKKIWSLKTKQ